MSAARGSPGKFANERASPPNPAFDREMARVRRRVADEYEHERFGTRPVHVHASAQAREFTPSVWSFGGHRAHGGSYDAGRYYDAGGGGGIDDDPGESGYADFKLVAAAFRVWVRHASALRALRVAREAAVENWMISVSFWECQTLKRGLERWRGRRNVMQLHALRFWYGEALRAAGTRGSRRWRAIVFSNRAMARLKLGAYAEAEEDCGEALKLDPRNVKAHLRRGAARAVSGNYLEALEDFESALRLEPRNRDARAEVSRMKNILGEANPIPDFD